MTTASKILTKMLGSVVQSSAKSLLGTQIKKTVNGLIKNLTKKSQENIEKEIVERLGYMSSHYRLDKDQNILFKPSPIFFHEWLNNSPIMAGRIIKDEENGSIFIDDKLIENSHKVEIIKEFIKNTDAQSAALGSYLTRALDFFDASDFIGKKFAKTFDGWTEGTPSVIDEFLQGCFGTALETDEEYSRLIFRRWMISAARRIMKPGSVADLCFTLQGKPGVGKSAFLKNLMPSPFDERTGIVYCDIRNPQKLVENLIGLSIANMDELNILEIPKTTEVFKMLLSATSVITRLPWRRDPKKFDLRVAFAATTNKSKFINDEALKRRMGVIELNGSQKLNFQYLEEQKSNLWKESVWLANQGISCTLDIREQERVESFNTKFI